MSLIPELRTAYWNRGTGEVHLEECEQGHTPKTRLDLYKGNWDSFQVLEPDRERAQELALKEARGRWSDDIAEGVEYKKPDGCGHCMPSLSEANSRHHR